MNIINGKKIAEKILDGVKREIDQQTLELRLDVIRAGNTAETDLYLRVKKKTAEKVGIEVKTHEIKSTDEGIKLVRELTNDEKCTGYYLQLPVTKAVDQNKITETFCPWKDVDGMSPFSLGQIVQRNEEALVSATALAILEVIQRTAGDTSTCRLLPNQVWTSQSRPCEWLKGQNICVINDSALIGRPLSALLLNRGATVTICHEFTKDLKEHTQNADILITAVGKPGLVTADMVKKGAVVVDAGMMAEEAKNPKGDVDFESVKEKASHITPVPGGVGPVTVACLLRNVVRAHRLSAGSIVP